MEWEGVMEIVKVLALGAAVGAVILTLLTWLMTYLIRTQYKWRKLPPPDPNSPVGVWLAASKASK